MSTRHVKPTTVALTELGAEKVPWRKVTAEEYEVLLQQEIAAKEAEEHAPVLFPIPPPIIPVIVEAATEIRTRTKGSTGPYPAVRLSQPYR